MKLNMPMDIRKERGEAYSKRGPYAHLFSEYEADESIVGQYWESIGGSVERLDAENKRNPDFLIRFANGALALCEVKSFGGPETGQSDYSLAYPPDLRISNALYTGIRQLLEYETDEAVYRILFFVNHNDKLKFDSLVKMLDGEWDPIKRRFLDTPNDASLGARIERKKIDLYLWLRDTPASSAESPSQRWGRLDRVNEICNAMRLNPKQIRLIPAA
jgi:hypothetical protein